VRASPRGGPICRVTRRWALGFLWFTVAFGVQAQPNLPRAALAAKYFGADAPWYLRNIPFLEIDDAEIQAVYYYRWKVFKSHIREIGSQGATVLEFLDNVPWARQPFTDLNDSASFHILEGRWLRDPGVIDSLIDHLYSGGGNDRHFSESIAAATESRTRVTGDVTPGLRHLEEMRAIYEQWDDHFDQTRGLYWIEPLLDATEYTIASIDASGAGFTDSPSSDQNHNGFTGGFAFRPSINSYQYANALAIARFAELAGRPTVAADYLQKAAALRAAVLSELWNPTLNHFLDRYQRSTSQVTAGEFIRGRELVGFVPWAFELPPSGAAPDSHFDGAWAHVLAATEFAGPYGLRTVEPSYSRYLTQYRYESASGLPECQWNGPSWPFQTSQVLTGLANLLDDYQQTTIGAADYLHLLRQYARQHLGGDEPDIQEDYNPDTGQPIVGLARSHHYEHSTFVDLILNGLIGLRPRSDETLEIAPLIPTTRRDEEGLIRHFAVQSLAYHGHDIGIFFDADGDRYGSGRGLSVFVDGKQRYGPGDLRRVSIPLSAQPPGVNRLRRIDLAANPGIANGPMASASSVSAGSDAAEAIDGRLWFFPSNRNGWSPAGQASSNSWYAVDLRETRRIGSAKLYFFAEGAAYLPPKAFRLQYQTPKGWRDIPSQHHLPMKPLGNGENTVTFPPLLAKSVRVVFTRPGRGANFRLIEVKVFAP
jgi:hypothetical protein